MNIKMLILFFSLISTSAFANFHSGEISGYIPYSQDSRKILIFKVTGMKGQGCNTTSRFAIDSNSLKYDATVSAIMAAFHSKTPVRVRYYDTCKAWGNSADVSHLCVGDISC